MNVSHFQNCKHMLVSRWTNVFIEHSAYSKLLCTVYLVVKNSYSRETRRGIISFVEIEVAVEILQETRPWWIIIVGGIRIGRWKRGKRVKMYGNTVWEAEKVIEIYDSLTLCVYFMNCLLRICLLDEMKILM